MHSFCQRSRHYQARAFAPLVCEAKRLMLAIIRLLGTSYTHLIKQTTKTPREGNRFTLIKPNIPNSPNNPELGK